VDDAVLVLSPTHKQEPDSCGLTFSPPKQDQQQQQQCPPGGSASDSGSSSSAASPVTPTAPGTTMALSNSDASATACADTDAAAAAAATVAAAADAFELPCLDSAVELSATNVTASPDATAAAAADSCVSPVAPAGGFGFSFPTTPPSAVDAAVHEERAERVFSTWASNHSRSLSGALDLEFAAAGEDAEGGCC
jgi:hypothetical protein